MDREWTQWAFLYSYQDFALQKAINGVPQRCGTPRGVGGDSGIFASALLLEWRRMHKRAAQRSSATTSLPLVVEKDEDGLYVVECPVLPGCYSQGRSLDEALSNISEVIALIKEETEVKEILHGYHPQHISFLTITV